MQRQTQRQRTKIEIPSTYNSLESYADDAVQEEAKTSQAPTQMASLSTGDNRISIPLPKAYNARLISTDSEIIDSVTRMFCVVDRFVTPVRVTEVFENFVSGESGVGTIHTGLSQDSYLFGLYCLGLAGIALCDEHIYRVEQRRKDKTKQNIYKLLEQNLDPKQNDEPISDDASETLQQMSREQIINNLNYYLNHERIANEALKKKYSAIFIDAKTKELVFQRQDSAKKEPKILKSKILGSVWEYGVKPFYRAGGFAGFAFWIMWMVAAATTGIQAEGIYGMAPWAAAAVPAGFGLMHLGLYYYKALKYGGFEKARQHDEAVADFDVLLNALKQRQYGREMEYLKKRSCELDAELKKRGLTCETVKSENKNLMIQTPNGILEQPWVKGAFTVVTNSAATWGNANSYSWYIKVLIETVYASVVPAVLSAPLIGTVVGGVILGLAGLSGIYNAYKRFDDAKTLKDAPLKALDEKYDIVVVPKGQMILHPVQNKIYVQEKDGHIAYTLVTLDNKIVREFEIKTLNAPQTFDIDNVSKLKKQILEATLTAGHTTKTPVPLEEFEKHYKARLEYLEKLKAKMQGYKNIFNIPENLDVAEKNVETQVPKSFLGQCKEAIYDAGIAFRNHPLIDAWDMSLTGLFVGRVLFTMASPFLLAPLLPVVLTGPIGIAAIAGVGLAYLGMKWYEKYQIKKEQRAKQLPGMLDEVEKNIEEAELVVNDMIKTQALKDHDVILETQKPLIEKRKKEGREYNPAPLLKHYFGSSIACAKATDNQKPVVVVEHEEYKPAFARQLG